MNSIQSVNGDTTEEFGLINIIDANGKLLWVDTAIVRSVFSSNGIVSKVIKRNGITDSTKYTYSALGQLDSMINFSNDSLKYYGKYTEGVATSDIVNRIRNSDCSEILEPIRILDKTGYIDKSSLGYYEESVPMFSDH